MKDYQHSKIEKKWQKQWEKKKSYKTPNKSPKKKHYVLDMFPYPSGTGLHVGHPKGYIGSDVYARMKRMQGFNVLHPMGYDAFGLPAEQYAVQHNIQPKKAVAENVKTFEKQLSIIGLSYDWDRRVNTTDPEFYKWTQWIFLKIYNSWYNKKTNKAEPIEKLISAFEKSGNKGVRAVTNEWKEFTGAEWKAKTDLEKQEVLMKYRLAYEGYSEVNWCQELGTVLANDEILDGPTGPVSERGGFPVEKKMMRQWFMRITAYANRLLSGLEGLNWSDHIKEIQKNWIGESEGAEITFEIVFDAGQKTAKIPVFTTRPDTLFGVTYIVLARDHAWVTLATDENHHGVLKNRDEVIKYIEQSKKSEPHGKEKTGIQLHGVNAVNPATGEKIPVFIADYVLASYGTGAVMAVPAHDERDWEFAQKYNLPIKEVVLPNIIDKRNPPVVGKKVIERRSVHPIVKDSKTGKFLALKWKKFDWTTFPMGGVDDGEDIVDAARREVREETGFINLKLIKVLSGKVRAEYFAAHKDQNRVAYTTAVVFELENDEQVEVAQEEKDAFDITWLPESDMNYDVMTHAETNSWREKLSAVHGAYLGEGVLVDSGTFSGMRSEEARKKITKFAQGKIVTQYKMRDAIFARQRYWGEPIPLFHNAQGLIVEVSENKLPLKLPDVKSYKPTGTGESPLAGVSSWVKAGYETNTMPGWAGSSWYFLRYMDPKNKKSFADKTALSYWKNVDMYVGGAEHATGHLLYSRFWHKVLKDYELVPTEEPFQTLRNQGIILGTDGRKMSKRWGNVVNPDEIVKTYGADTLRVYEMFMGPFEGTLPWSTENIIGSRRFIERVWRMAEKIETQGSKIIHRSSNFDLVLHKTIKKVGDDIQNFAFNTAISAMMILLNEIEKQESVSRKDFEMFLKILSPFAPHVAEELWSQLGNKTLIVSEKWPAFDSKKMVESEMKIVVQVNSKMRAVLLVDPSATEAQITELAMKDMGVNKWISGKNITKIIYISGKLLNIVLGG